MSCDTFSTHLTFYLHTEAGGLILVIVGVITGVLFQQNYLMIPDTIPFLSLWYCCNIATVLDGLLVLALDGWQTDFLGVKPGKYLGSKNVSDKFNLDRILALIICKNERQTNVPSTISTEHLFSYL